MRTKRNPCVGVLSSFMKVKMFDALNSVLKASAIRRQWHLVCLETPRKKYSWLLYYQNPNKLVLFVLFEGLEYSSKGNHTKKCNIFRYSYPALIFACTEDCYNLITCTSFTVGLQPAPEVHPSTRCEPQTKFTGSLQKYQLEVSVGFSSTSSLGLPLPAYFRILFYHLHFKEECLQFFYEPRLILGTKVDKCFLPRFFGQNAHCLQVPI